MAKPLQTNDRKDFLFELKQEYKMYKNLQSQIKECDIEIEKLLQEQIDNDHNKKQHYKEPKPPSNLPVGLDSLQTTKLVEEKSLVVAFQKAVIA